MGGKKPLRRPLWLPTRATASNYYPLGLDGAGGAAKPLLRAPKKPAPLHGRLPAFSGAVDAFERARKCFLEWRYFFSIILSEFLKNRVALQELSLLSTAVGNMSSEVFTPLQVLSVTVAIPAEQCLVLVLQSRVGEPLEADYITRQLNYLQSACAQYIHCEAAFYPEGPQPFEQASEIYQKLLQQRSENVALKGGILLGRPAEKVPEVFRIPQIGAWQKLLQAGCAQAMEQEACQLLDKLTVNNQLNSQTLRYFYQDFMQMLFSFPEKKRQGDMFREPEALELYRNGMKTVPDMKALVHYVASVWDNETEESSQSTVEIIMAYIAEHLENELRREELADAVHLNPDYMARLFKKETGMNLKDYIIQQKMQEAQSLLCTTNLPISLIAAKVGYTNFGHFSTSYKKFYHKTPQEERSAAL